MNTESNLLWLIAILVGGVAGWLDWKNREVPNWLWVTGLALATPLLLLELWNEPLAFGIRLGLALLFFVSLLALWFGDAIGGGDVKGFALFALILSPVGYFDGIHGKIYPALDVLVTALVLSIPLKLVKVKSIPLFTVSQWPLLLAPVAGGLIWWPFLSLTALIN